MTTNHSPGDVPNDSVRRLIRKIEQLPLEGPHAKQTIVDLMWLVGTIEPSDRQTVVNVFNILVKFSSLRPEHQTLFMEMYLTLVQDRPEA